MATLSTISIKLDADTMNFGRKLDAARNNVMDFGQKVQPATSSLASLATNFGIAGGAAGLAFGAINSLNDAMTGLAKSTAMAAVEYARFGISVASEIQDAETSMSVLLGSTSAAEEMVRDLREFAAETPLEFQGLQRNANTLLAFGGAAEDVMPTLKMLGDVSMGNADAMGRLTLAYAQVQAAGRLMGQDLLQLTNAGFNPLARMAERTGQDFGELQKMMQDGKFTFEMVQEEFRIATAEGGDFDNAMGRLSENFNASWAKMIEANRELAGTFGEALLPAAQEATEKTEGYLKSLALVAEKTKPVLTSTFSELADDSMVLAGALAKSVDLLNQFGPTAAKSAFPGMSMLTQLPGLPSMEGYITAAHAEREGERVAEAAKRAAEAADAAEKKRLQDETKRSNEFKREIDAQIAADREKALKEAEEQQKKLREAQKQLSQLTRSAERFGRGIGQGIEGGLKEVARFLERDDVRELADIGPAGAHGRNSIGAQQAILAAQRINGPKAEAKMDKEKISLMKQVVRLLEKTPVLRAADI